MAWLELRRRDDGAKRYRVRERIDGRTITVIRNAGFWKEAAQKASDNFEKAVAQGFIFTGPITVPELEEFLKAKAAGRDLASQGTRLTIEKLFDLYLEIHGPSVKGGINSRYQSPYYNLKSQLKCIRDKWAGKYADEITKFDVRDFLAEKNAVGTRMRYLTIISGVFSSAQEWNEEEPVFLKSKGIPSGRIALPPFNPAKKWRKKMKSSEKLELPDTRVLSLEEWEQFKVHLTPRAYQICDIALRRFLRLGDIRKLSEKSYSGGMIRGRQQKTGDPFTTPMVAGHLGLYDFTNFEREFDNAQKKAGMDYPKDHPLHFTPRCLRRTGATWAYRKTKDLRAIQKMLGHRSINTTVRYLAIDDADVLKVAQAVDEVAGIGKVLPPAENSDETTN